MIVCSDFACPFNSFSIKIRNAELNFKSGTKDDIIRKIKTPPEQLMFIKIAKV